MRVKPPTTPVKSEDQSAQTRRRVVEAARRLLSESGYHQLSLEEVAKAAGVTRATVYYQFRSKVGVLEAVIAAAEMQTPVPGRGPTQPEPDIREPGEFIERSCAFWSANEDVARNVISLGMIDDEVRTLTRGLDQQRRANLAELVRRWAGDGRVLTSEAEAVDVLWLLSSFAGYEHLKAGPPERSANDVVSLLTRLSTTVVTPSKRRAPPPRASSPVQLPHH